MALFDGSNEDRTEPASPYRREEFRKQGKVALSREVLSVALLLVAGLVLSLAAGNFLTQFGWLAGTFFRFDAVGDFGKREMVDFAWQMGTGWAAMVWPVFLGCFVAGIVVCVAQVGIFFTTQPLTPNFDRLNPINGLQRLMSSKGLVEAVKVLFKMAIAGWVLYVFFKGMLPSAATFLQRSVSEVVELQLTTLSRFFFTLVGVFAVLAALDYAFQRYTLEKEMRMTRREARDELKMREGDPMVKARIRGIQRRLASRRMMEDVPKADVVVTNPTHIAVALRYDQESMSAPKVVAKGAGVVAEKIRELAKKHRVPIVENKPLARTLFRKIRIGHFVPKELYKAVAEVLAYVYRLKVARQRAFQGI